MTPRRRTTPAVLAAGAAAVLLVAGCSSSSGSAAPSVTSSPPTTAASAATPAPAPVASVPTAAVSAATSAAAVPAVSPTAGTGSSETTGGSSSADRTPPDPVECASVAQAYGAIINATMPVLQGRTGPEPFDADALAKALDIDTMGDLPAELAPDFAAFKSAVGQLRGKDLTAAAALLNGPEMTKASNDIDKYVSDRC